MANLSNDVFINLLEKHGICYDNLPLLKRDPSKNGFRIDYNEMNSPIMKYDHTNTYCTERCIVFALHGHGLNKVQTLKGNPPVNKIKGTLRFVIQSGYDKYSECKEELFVWAVENPWIIPTAINDLHNRNGHIGSCIDVCETCPLINSRYSLTWITEILTGTNPLFKLAKF
jgi:hypothetical protein